MYIKKNIFESTIGRSRRAIETYWNEAHVQRSIAFDLQCWTQMSVYIYKRETNIYDHEARGAATYTYKEPADRNYFKSVMFRVAVSRRWAISPWRESRWLRPCVYIRVCARERSYVLRLQSSAFLTGCNIMSLDLPRYDSLTGLSAPLSAGGIEDRSKSIQAL